MHAVNIIGSYAWFTAINSALRVESEISMAANNSVLAFLALVALLVVQQGGK